MSLRPLVQRFCAVLFALTLAAPAFAGRRSEIDQSATPHDARSARVAPARAVADLAVRGGVSLGDFDERYGVPSFVWGAAPAAPSGARSSAAIAKPVRTHEQAARAYLGTLAALYHLQPSDVSGAVLHEVHDNGRGGVIARFRAQVNGIDVFREETSVLMDRSQNLLAVAGSIPSAALAANADARAFVLPADRAVTLALQDYSETLAEPVGVVSLGKSEGGYERFAPPASLASLMPELAVASPVRAKPVYFRQPDALVPAYYVEVMGEGEWYSYVIGATDGAMLFRHLLTDSDVFTYRAWANASSPQLPHDGPEGTGSTPHPTGVPDGYTPSFIAPSLVALQNGPLATNDPWLPSGATVSTGNNADAYADLSSPDGFSAGDVRATTTSANTFDRTYDVNLAPNASNAQQQAAVTQLFYNVNFFHDWYYDNGYNEAAGNMQTNNFGRGGLGGDPILAEAQDYSGTNNANMSTPADGSSGRMQMYVWTATGVSSLTITAPAAIAGTYATGAATFGPQTFNVTAPFVLAVDGTAPTSDGCSAFTNAAAMAGKIAIVDRGTCSFGPKVQNAQAAGAVGCIIIDNVTATNPPSMGGTSTATIPVLSVTLAVGNAIKAQLATGVTGTLFRGPAGVNRDGDVDNQIVAHEWGHNISNRLIGNASGLSNQMGGGMGEGWADFHAMLMTVRPEDASVPSNANFNGTYGMGGYATDHTVVSNNAYYWGIRRYPYSTDMTKNPLTFQHITTGVVLPVGVPRGPIGSADNAEVHNQGEVWCNMLWECYAALLRDTGRLTFAQARERMKDELIAGYKLTPNAPTFTEARDALLAAALARDPADFALFWTAFAKRGLGVGAISPDRFSATNVGLVESYVVGGDLSASGITLTDDVVSCDHDGYVDNGETGTLQLTLRNNGSVALTQTTVSVSSAVAGVTFPGGNSRNLGTLALAGNSVVTFPVKVTGMVAPTAADFVIQYNDPALAVAGPRTTTFSALVNADEVASTFDDAEAVHTTWTAQSAAGSAGLPWVRTPGTGSNHVYHGDDAGDIEDQSLVSAPIQVPPTGNFDIKFKHAYSFEKDAGGTYDGGVIEISTDNGATWSDIGPSASPGYNGTLFSGSGNPLAGHGAYVGTNTSYPNMDSVTVFLGNTYAGQTVRIRFRVTADAGVGAAGWNVDDIRLPNVGNTPFLALVNDPTVCALAAVDDAAPTALAFALASGNPSHGTTRFRFALPTAQRVHVALYDIAGREVATIADGEYSAGWHDAVWTGEGVARATGVYLARMTAGGQRFTQRIVVIR